MRFAVHIPAMGKSHIAFFTSEEAAKAYVVGHVESGHTEFVAYRADLNSTFGMNAPPDDPRARARTRLRWKTTEDASAESSPEITGLIRARFVEMGDTGTHDKRVAAISAIRSEFVISTQEIMNALLREPSLWPASDDNESTARWLEQQKPRGIESARRFLRERGVTSPELQNVYIGMANVRPLRKGRVKAVVKATSNADIATMLRRHKRRDWKPPYSRLKSQEIVKDVSVLCNVSVNRVWHAARKASPPVTFVRPKLLFKRRAKAAKEDCV